MKIQVTDGKNTTYRYRKQLAAMGLAFHRGKNQRGYWETDEIERPNFRLKYFCKKNKLSYTEINTAFLRSNDYQVSP